jgi:hypothetical protein
MAYSDFTLEDLREKFGIQNWRRRIFGTVTPVTEISGWLQQTLQMAEGLSVVSEKAKSEFIVVPILMELRNRNDRFFTIFSGDNLNANESQGLKGECDFILAKDIGSFDVSFPILQVVEAKKHDIDLGIPQCAAQMLGAKIYNEKKKHPLSAIYGCVTTGDDWLFMKLEDDLLVDPRKYYLGNLGELLGAFQIIIDYYKAELP